MEPEKDPGWGVWIGSREKEFKRRHSGWREQCISHFRDPPFPSPNIEHGIWEKKKKKERRKRRIRRRRRRGKRRRRRRKVFWLLGRCRPPSPQAQVGEGVHM